MVLPNNYITSEGEAGKKEKTTIWGWKTVVAQYSGGSYEELGFSPLAGKDDLADIDRHPWPTVDAQDYCAFAAQCDAHKDRALIGASSWGPISWPPSSAAWKAS